MSDEQVSITRQQLVAAFNEWMRRYTEYPELFAHDWEIVQEFLKAKNSGIEPCYGEEATAFLLQLLG